MSGWKESNLSIVVVALLLLLPCTLISGQTPSCTPQESEDLLESLLNLLTERRRPTSPTIVNVTYAVFDIKEVDEVKGIILLQGLISQSWIDPRLQSSVCTNENFWIPIPEELRNMVWVPRTAVTSSVGADIIAAPVPLIDLNLYPSSGRLVYESAQMMRLPCKTDYRKFPFDSIKCDFFISKFSLSLFIVNDCTHTTGHSYI